MSKFTWKKSIGKAIIHILLQYEGLNDSIKRTKLDFGPDCYVVFSFSQWSVALRHEPLQSVVWLELTFPLWLRYIALCIKRQSLPYRSVSFYDLDTTGNAEPSLRMFYSETWKKTYLFPVILLSQGKVATPLPSSWSIPIPWLDGEIVMNGPKICSSQSLQFLSVSVVSHSEPTFPVFSCTFQLHYSNRYMYPCILSYAVFEW